jgi:RecA/RadA recombinase
VSPVDSSTLDDDLRAINERRGPDSIRRGNEQPPIDRIPLLSPALMRITSGGIPLGRVTRLWGDPGTGKALAIDTSLPTPTGWTTMGDVQIGDQLLDERGRPCSVVGKSDVMYDHDVYVVEFDDGSEIRADAEHRWLTTTRAARVSAGRSTGGGYGGVGRATFQESQRRHFPEVVTTEEIVDTLRCSDGRLNHSVAVAEPLQLAEDGLPLEPYLLGVWLGDGTRGQGNFTSMDSEIVEAFSQHGFVVRQHSYLGSGRARRYGVLGLAALLKQVGVFEHKHIPLSYLRASVSQRWELLRGLMDTDGTVSVHGSCSFTQADPGMMRGFRELLSGLGLKSSLGSTKRLAIGSKTYFSQTCFFQSPVPPFRLVRKIERWREPQRGVDRHRMIVGVHKTKSQPVQCVAVDSPSQLYLAGETMIPTHNTHVGYLIIAAAQAIRNKRFPKGLEAAYWNVEKVWDAVHAKNLGVDTKRVLLEEITIIEDIAREMELLLHSCHVHVLDSASSATCMDELAGEAEDWTRALDARAWKRAIRRIDNALDKDENALIIIDHAARDQQTKQEFALGGKALEYRSSMSLHFRKGSWLFYHPTNGYLERDDKIKGETGVSPSGQKEADGIEVIVRVNKSRVCRPFRVARLRLDLNTFLFDTAFELLDAATFFDVDGNAAHRSGQPAIAQRSGAKSAWYQLPSGEKVQGEPGIRKRIVEDPELAAMITKAMLAGQ